MIELYPMKMGSVFVQTVWGGNRLKTDFAKAAAPPHTGESWELSAVAGSESAILNGVYTDRNLNRLGEEDREAFWGSRCRDGRFPMLVKLIDAAENLSVQVHPSDATADAALGEQGKAEMWYVLDAKPGACLYLGFSRNVRAESVMRGCEDGSVLSMLNRVSVSRGDVFFIPPGTVHAIGKGLTLAEIQQSSDTTFRIYDYQRPDANGQPRTLHWERARAVMNYGALIPEGCRANSLVQLPEFTMSELFSCAYFRSYKLTVKKAVTLSCDGKSFRSLLCTEGAGTIRYQGADYPVSKGQSYFLPAALGKYELSGSCTVLLSWV